MSEQTESLRLRRSIAVYAALGILVIGAAVALATIHPFYGRLQEDQERNLNLALTTRARAVGEFLQRAGDNGIAITSRSKLRQALESYNDGELTQEELVAFSIPILKDALHRSDNVAGITRLDRRGQAVVSVGLPIPQALWTIPPDGQRGATIAGPVHVRGARYVVVGAPILDREEVRQGTDIVLFGIEPLEAIVTDLTGLGQTGENLLGISSGSQAELVFEAQRHQRQPDSDYLWEVQDLVERGLQGESGIRHGVRAADEVFAYGPVPSSGWAMLISMRRSELYAPLRTQLLFTSGVISALLLVGTLGTVVFLRPLTARAVHANELERQVVERTRALEEELAQRKKTEEKQRRLEQQVQRTQKLEGLGVLAGGIAHDFNNLLVGILGHADLVLVDLPPDHPSREDLESIATTAKRAAELCRQLLAYAGKGKFVVEPLDLRLAVEEISELIEVSLSKNAVLETHFAADLPPISADATQVRQIVMNLITNASEAIGDQPGTIRVSVGALDCDPDYLSDTWLPIEGLEPGRYCYFEVADTGSGMDPETRGKIFDPFFTTKFAGRGLGLAAVLGIVRAHRGALRVYSEPGQGTTIKVLFPGLTTGEQAVAPRPTPDTEGWRGSGTVLLVDDEAPVLAVGRRMLERLGFEVLVAQDGQEALEVFDRSEGIRCVVLDMTMPRLNGLETFRELRRRDADVRVILTSGHNEQEVTSQFVGKELAGFVQKPYALTDLSAAIRQSLEA